MSADREFPFGSRRRSVDVGGLALALGAVSLGNEGMEMGKGWGGWEENEFSGALYAELLSDMYTQTQSAVNQPVLPSLSAVSVTTRHRLIDALDSWHFEPHKLSDEEGLACTLLLFEALFRIEGMQEAIGVSIAQLSSFLLHLRQAYRATNSYHNFQHALDVFQATHIYLRSAGAVPPVAVLHWSESDPRGRWRAHDEIRATWAGILRKEDLFALYIAAIGHDVGHPGFNNMFMKNAQAPLSQVYDHKSALEQMHCAFLLPIMKRYGLAHLLGLTSAGTQFRRLLLDTVLATDMGVHGQFMQRFASLMENPSFFDITQARTLLCQALIKCADISNPSRPHTVSQHWSAALASEWSSQACLERQLCLPVSVQDSDDPVTEANGQISFITLFCSPLLEITTIAVPEMKCFAEQCATNCKLWRARLSDLKERAEPLEPNYPPVPYRAVSPPRTQDYLTAFPLSLPAQLLNPISRPPSMMDSDSIIGSESGIGMEHERERTTRGDSSDIDAARFSLAGVSNGNGNCPSAAPYEESASSSSRSASPASLANGASSISPNSSYRPQQTLRSIGIPVFAPLSEFSPATEATSGSISPHSEYVPRTPGSYAGGHVRPVASNGSLNGSSSGAYTQVPEPISSIRAAYKLSVRKKKSFHRNSWTPSLSTSSPYTTALGPPTPSRLSASPNAGPASRPMATSNPERGLDTSMSGT
ncbi:hypothetical protein M0805_008721 [Coniferiporia weirii]|nr:hypothetical protein M0805_008721 [Coniferiporia weirii]